MGHCPKPRRYAGQSPATLPSGSGTAALEKLGATPNPVATLGKARLRFLREAALPL